MCNACDQDDDDDNATDDEESRGGGGDGGVGVAPMLLPQTHPPPKHPPPPIRFVATAAGTGSGSGGTGSGAVHAQSQPHTHKKPLSALAHSFTAPASLTLPPMPPPPAAAAAATAGLRRFAGPAGPVGPAGPAGFPHPPPHRGAGPFGTVDPRLVDVCFYHGNCLDGALCAALIKRVAPRARCVPISWTSLDTALATGAVVVFADVTPKAPLLHAVLQVAAAVMAIDHHVSAWCTLTTVLPPVAFMFDVRESAATLVWTWITSWLGAAAGPFPPLLPYAKALDLFDWSELRDPDALRVCRAYEATTQPTVESLLGVLEEGERFLGNLRGMLDAVEAVIGLQISRAVASSEVVLLHQQYPRVRVGVVNTQTGVNFLALHMYSVMPIDVVWAWYYHARTRRVRVLLRSGGRFDCEAYASQFGGGGHPNAAAFTCELSVMRSHFCEPPDASAVLDGD